MIVNLPDKFLKNHTRIQEIRQHHRGFIEENRNCLKSVAHHAAGIGTCTLSGMINPSYLSSEMHQGRFPDHTEFQSWIVNFRTEVCSKAQNPTRAFAVDQGNRSNQITG